MDLFVIDTKGKESFDNDVSESEEEFSENEAESGSTSGVDTVVPKEDPDSSEEEKSDDESNSDSEADLYQYHRHGEHVEPGSLLHAWRHGRDVANIVKEEDDECIVIPEDEDEEAEEGTAPKIITEIPKMLQTTKITVKKKKKQKGDYDLSDTYIDYKKNKHGVLAHKASDTLLQTRQSTIHKLLKNKSLAHQPGLEQLECVPNQNMSDRKKKNLRRFERAKNKGKEWFNLPATEVTEEVKRDLEVLQMRSVLDPKTFYKKNDLKVLPKFFQIGRVQDNAADFYHSRIPKKDRKRTMVDELLADAEFQKRSKQKFKEIVAEKRKTDPKAHRNAKKLKRKKK